jgi:hypothetical protein
MPAVARSEGASGVRSRRPTWRRTWTAAVLVLVAVVVSGCSVSSSKPSAGVNVSVFHLKEGDCLVPPTTVKAELSTVKVVSCREPHTQEVFALVTDPGGDDYPGASKLESFANGNCLQHYQAYVGIAYQDSSLFYTYLLPSVRSWSANDRTIVCVITTTGQKLTSSVRGSKR